MGHIAILDVVGAPPRFRIRLAGTSIVEYDHADFTGRYLDEAVPAHAQKAIIGPYQACVSQQAPLYDIILSPFRSGIPYTLCRLMLPCASDGWTIDIIISGIYCDPWDRLANQSIYDTLKRRDEET